MFKHLCSLCLVLLIVSIGKGQGESFDSAGVKIHYEMIGQGEPVVLVHGFAVSGKTNWASLFEKLAAEHQVILMDVRGHGRSGKPHQSADYGLQMVEDVVRLLDHVNIRQAHVAGYSMGGLITLKLATRYPERLKSASIGGAAWLRPDQPEAPQFIEQVAKSLDEGNGPLPLLERLNPSADIATLARVKSTNSLLKIMNDCKALAAAFRSFPSLAIAEPELVSCPVPVQFLIGTKDPAPTSVPELKAVAPDNFRIIEIKNADHLTTITAPTFYQQLTEFIQQHK